jgi:hypothetical protein
MKQMHFAGEQHWDERHCWELRLRRPDGIDPNVTPNMMTASEQMFFLNAPVAHVLDYEKHLRARRNRGAELPVARFTRLDTRAAVIDFPVVMPSAAAANA